MTTEAFEKYNETAPVPLKQIVCWSLKFKLKGNCQEIYQPFSMM